LPVTSQPAYLEVLSHHPVCFNGLQNLDLEIDQRFSCFCVSTSLYSPEVLSTIWYR
ncbi:hypothetical protein BaRGS_00035777, partial [Batillaria attramentaria]